MDCSIPGINNASIGPVIGNDNDSNNYFGVVVPNDKQQEIHDLNSSNLNQNVEVEVGTSSRNIDGPKSDREYEQPMKGNFGV